MTLAPGARVLSVFEDTNRKYASDPRWTVRCRLGDVVELVRFRTEAEALAFAATADNVG